jgi:hypothetical protein
MINKSTHKKQVSDYNIQAEKFWSGVSIGDAGECWEWQRGRNTTGYGLFSVLNTAEAYERTGRTTSQVLAHRVVASLSGNLGVSDYVMHKCDNRACCNPAHLQIGTAMDNYMDMINKGRAAWQK